MPCASAVTPDRFTTFGGLLKFLRRRAGLTQRELSIAVGYSESQISRLEQNERAPDEASLAARFIPALHMEAEPQWAARLLELGKASRVEGEPISSPPTAEARSTPHNLPIQLTSFIGREKEMAEIRQLLGGRDDPVGRLPAGGDVPPERLYHRLVTLTGHGGCGKTRLALQVGGDLLNSFPDGVWLIELAPVGDPAFVPQTIAAVLGLKEEAGRPLLSTLIDYLRDKTMLFILDNCEHLIQASAQLAEALLHACPNLCILATSREMLGVAGERAVYVPSLSMPPDFRNLRREAHDFGSLSQYEAVRLFVDRAAIVMPSFTLTHDNALPVAQICQRLDGIPLALELAAARLRMLPVEQIATRLDDAFRLLTGGNRTALPHHQTLQALIDWSYELLTEAEQVVFRRLAVFAGGWALEAAEAVCVEEGIKTNEVFDLLAHLLDKSLVLAEEHSKAARYRMLETIRQYALAKLAASGEADAVRQRHAVHYLTLAEAGAEASNYASTKAWHEQMETEYDNLRAALTWSLSAQGSAELELRLAGMLGWFWYVRGYWSEGRGWLEGALAHADVERVDNTQLRAWALQGLGFICTFQGDYAAGQAHFADSLKLFQELGDVSQSAFVLSRIGWLARERGDTTTARLLLEESLATFRKLGDKANIAEMLNPLGEVLVMQEDSEGATRLLEESLTLFRELGDPNGIGWALNHLGHVAQIQGEYERATRLHEESLPLFREIGLRWLGIPWAHQGLGETALAQGDAALATPHFTEALALFRDLGDRAGMSWCLAGLAGVAAVNEEPERAARLWGAAEAVRQSIGVREAPASHTTHERLQAEVRRQLGEAAFNSAWAEGQAASVEQAIAVALRFAE